jgi:hypothetical protein
MGNKHSSQNLAGNNSINSITSTTYGMYKVPYVSSAINVNTENLQKCLNATTTSTGYRTCIQNNVSAIVKDPYNGGATTNKNVTYFGPGMTNTEQITTVTQNQYSPNPGEVVSKTINQSVQRASLYPTSTCYENFDSENSNNSKNYESDSNYDVNIESNKIFCFNGTFTILTIFILILLLIFINTESLNKSL